MKTANHIVHIKVVGTHFLEAKMVLGAILSIPIFHSPVRMDAPKMKTNTGMIETTTQPLEQTGNKKKCSY